MPRFVRPVFVVAGSSPRSRDSGLHDLARVTIRDEGNVAPCVNVDGGGIEGGARARVIVTCARSGVAMLPNGTEYVLPVGTRVTFETVQ